MTARTPDSDANPPVAPDEYVSFGYFDPLLSRRIMHRVAREQLRFVARDATSRDWLTAEVMDEVSYRHPYPIIGRNNRVELLVHPEDQNRARKVIDEV